MQTRGTWTSESANKERTNFHISGINIFFLIRKQKDLISNYTLLEGFHKQFHFSGCIEANNYRTKKKRQRILRLTLQINTTCSFFDSNMTLNPVHSQRTHCKLSGRENQERETKMNQLKIQEDDYFSITFYVHVKFRIDFKKYLFPILTLKFHCFMLSHLILFSMIQTRVIRVSRVLFSFVPLVYLLQKIYQLQHKLAVIIGVLP